MNNFLKNYKIDMSKKDKWVAFGVAVGLILVLTIVPICVTLCALAYPKKVYANDYPAVTKVGYETEYLGETQRIKSDCTKENEGLTDANKVDSLLLLSKYPTYGSTPSNVTGAANETKRKALIDEAWSLCTVNTRIGTDGFPRNTYNRMDSEGNLFLNDSPYSAFPQYTDLHYNLTGVNWAHDEGQRKLYKHTASDGMYLGNVDDDEPGIIKKITMSPTRGYTRGYNVTGLYAAPGEIIKVEISDADMKATGGISIHIGQALFNGKANNIWVQKNQMNRMPVILNTWVIDKNTARLDEEKGVWTAYIGSFLGGPIYVVNESVKFSVTISGAVRYSHFILGYTTPEEYEENFNSSAPYFDLEVFYNGVLHSGPKRYAQNFTYDQIYDAAILWEKISLVSTQVSKQGIVFLYDPFVAAGGAVAFPGQGSVNCPMGWMASSLNYQSFVNSGAWGNMHEYNHNFQGWGVGDRGEVTNNSLNLVEYSLFTKISSARRMGSYGGEGLGGWNSYTSATWALQRVKTGSISSTNGLAVYATLLHNFGQDAFISTAHWSGQNYFLKWGEITHQNFSYFNSMVASYTGTYDLSAQADYPMFIPVSSVYQTGRSFMYDNEKRYIETMQPYVIKYGESFVVDLNKYKLNSANQYESGSIVIPDGFSYKIKKISKPANGKLKKSVKKDEDGKIIDNIYTFTPNKNLRSGKIFVTLEITNDNDPSMKIDDVDLVLEFEQSHEMNKNVLERKVYTSPESNHLYTTAAEAYKDNFKKYDKTYDADNINKSQNANTEIWGPHDSSEFNTMKMISGKLYVSTDGDYSISLRGRQSVYGVFTVVSKNKDRDGKTYTITINEDTGSNISAASYKNKIADFDDNTINVTTKYSVNIKGLETGDWIKFDAVVKVTQAISFVGLCSARWEPPTITSQLIDPNDESKGSQFVYGGPNQTITLPDGTIKTITTNSVVTDEEAALLKPTMSLGYATAYRGTYEFATAFESDYFILPSYFATDKIEYDNKGSLVEVKGYTQADGDQYNIGVLFDEDDTNYIHNTTYNITAENPFDIIVDLGEVITTNCMTIYGEPTRTYQPKDFVLYGGKTLNNMKQIAVVENAKSSNYNVVVNFDRQALRYYRLVCTKTFATGNKKFSYIAYRCIKFSYSFAGAKVVTPDDAMFTYRGNWKLENKLSTFGHVYSGKNAQVEFTFTGMQFAVYSFKSLNFDKFEVVIDGKTIPAVSIKNEMNKTDLAYLSPILKDGKHKIIIRSKAKFNIDSIAIWN